MDDLEREYSPSSRAGGSAEPHVARYRRESQQAAASLGGRVLPTAGGSLVVPAAAEGSPLLVFVHGGYWQLLSAAESLFLATGSVAEGWSFAAIEYTIAPEGTVGAMVDEVGVELAAVVGMVPQPSMVGVVGHSAGAHLAAMAALVRPARVRVDRVVLVSGVYDLRPLLATSVNDPLGLDDATAAGLSPQLLPVTGGPDVVVAWGDDDTDAFRAQSRAYAEHLRAAGAAVTELECVARHHFDVIDDVARRRTRLGELTLAPLSP